MEAIQRGVEKSAQHLSVVGDPRVPVGYQTLESSSAGFTHMPIRLGDIKLLLSSSQ